MLAIINGKEFTLRLTVGALRRLEEEAGRPFGAVLAGLAAPETMSIGDLVRLVVCAARESEREAVRQAAEESTVAELAGVMERLLNEAGMAGNRDSGGKEGNA